MLTTPAYPYRVGGRSTSGEARVKKILVETSGSFMLLDPYNGQEVQHNRPSVVVVTGFIEVKIAQGDLKVLSPELREEATDAEFAKYWKDSDRKAELAVASFVSAFGKIEASSKGTESHDADVKSTVWTRESLEELAGKDGIDGLRRVASPLGIKGRGKEELIAEILKAQDSQ